MLKRALLSLLILPFLATAIVAAPPAHPDADWLTWTMKDVNGDAIDTEALDNTVYVFLFRPDNEDSCKSIRAASEYVRAHSNHADRVLAMCTDDTGAKAIKLFLRQEEYAKRVAAWEEEQAAALAAAQQANEPFTPEQMPDFVKEIEDELDDAEDLQALLDHHLPFATCQRCEEAWTWILERMNTPEGLPRILKINSQGQLVQEWTELPTNPNPLSGN